MPKGKKGKGKGKDKGKALPPIGSQDEEEATPKTTILQEELDKQSEEVAACQRRIHALQQENAILQKDCQQIRSETMEYMAYIEKKTTKRQHAIVTLSEQNIDEIKKIAVQKEAMHANYAKKKEDLNRLLMEKQAELKKLQEQLVGLSQWKQLQQEQEKTIRQLEKELVEMRVKNIQAIEEVKSEFLQKKSQIEEAAAEMIETTVHQAKQTSLKVLKERADHVRAENSRLREELKVMIEDSKQLRKQHARLLKERQQLEEEREYAVRLRNIRINQMPKEKAQQLGMLVQFQQSPDGQQETFAIKSPQPPSGREKSRLAHSRGSLVAIAGEGN